NAQPHTQQRPHTRQLESVFGTVRVTRTGYGGRGLQSLHPLDAQLNLPPELYSHTVRRRAAEAAAQTSYDEVLTTLEQTTGAHVPKRQAEATYQTDGDRRGGLYYRAMGAHAGGDCQRVVAA
ncbi:MAG: hypothetical protein ABR577_20375, partial [Pyrinomonadaceae bacterium]